MPGRWLMTVTVHSRRRQLTSSLKRRLLTVSLLVVVTLALLSVVMFSSWNVCRPDLDDDVEALAAADVAASVSTEQRRRRSDKICLSPRNDAGRRFDIRIDSDVDHERYDVSANATKPYTSIIHTMWSTSEIPTRWKATAKSWLRLNDKFVYCLWTDAELENFVADRYPWLLATYLAYPYPIQRADVARYLLLYHYGGIYVDLDVGCLTPLAIVFSTAPDSAGVLVAPTESIGVSPEFIAVRRPRDRVIGGLISGLRRAAASRWYPPLPYAAVMFRTGPVYFSRRLRCDGGEGRRLFAIPASRYFGVYVEHVPGSSWHSWDGRLIWRLFLLRRRIVLAAVVLSLFVFVCLFLTRRTAISANA